MSSLTGIASGGRAQTRSLVSILPQAVLHLIGGSAQGPWFQKTAQERLSFPIFLADFRVRTGLTIAPFADYPGYQIEYFALCEMDVETSGGI